MARKVQLKISETKGLCLWPLKRGCFCFALRKFFLFILIMTGLLGPIASAKENPLPPSEYELMEDDPEALPADESSEPTLEEKLIKSNIAISNWFDGVAEGLDLFLVGKKLTNRRNDTSVKIENSSFLTDGQGFKNTSGLGVNLRLPNLEDYFQLKFTSYDEKSENRTGKNNYLRQAPRERNYGASVGVFRKLGNIRTAFQPRVELQDPLKISHSLSFESVADMKTFKVNPKLEFFATPTKGTGVFQALNFNWVLSKIYSLTWINEGEYEEKLHKLTVNNGLALGEFVNPKSTLTYSWMFTSDNRDEYHLVGYSLAVSWNQLLYKKILDYELTPHLDFSKENSYRGIAGLVFSVNLNF